MAKFFLLDCGLVPHLHIHTHTHTHTHKYLETQSYISSLLFLVYMTSNFFFHRLTDVRMLEMSEILLLLFFFPLKQLTFLSRSFLCPWNSVIAYRGSGDAHSANHWWQNASSWYLSSLGSSWRQWVLTWREQPMYRVPRPDSRIEWQIRSYQSKPCG